MKSGVKGAGVAGLLLLLIGCAQVASAEVFQSSQSGNYLGSGHAEGWSCQIRLEATPAINGPINVMQVQCINASGAYRGGAASFGPSTVPGYCPQTGTQIPLIGFTGTDYVTFTSANTGSFYATLNGQYATFTRVGFVSVTPYSNCGSAGYINKPRD